MIHLDRLRQLGAQGYRMMRDNGRVWNRTLGGVYPSFRLRRVGAGLDTCHIFAAGYDLRTPDAYAATMKEFDDVIGLSYLKAIYIDDSKAPFRSQSQCGSSPPARGNVESKPAWHVKASSITALCATSFLQGLALATSRPKKRLRPLPSAPTHALTSAPTDRLPGIGSTSLLPWQGS
ncbi:hypothetical protein BDV95DRAFT_560227 [Massariosphaeria phaeospora]|uniref:Uncharacterized protein n=1 Tax=Massariosphaeria phaeospora TaxID=100035 RepID=A0A7C8MEE3_9PLEO|nr:hypothetical protein BDV95DRAFT_560227 [Massariosphaeria phaeospora]